MKTPSYKMPQSPIRKDVNDLLDRIVEREGGKKYEHLDRLIRIGMKMTKQDIAVGEGSR